MDQDGQLVTAQGYTLEPVINVPQDAVSLTIGRDGTVSARLDGQTAATQVGNIQLSSFINAAGLEAVGSNLYRETIASGAPQQTIPGQNGAGEVLQDAVSPIERAGLEAALLQTGGEDRDPQIGEVGRTEGWVDQRHFQRFGHGGLVERQECGVGTVVHVKLLLRKSAD